MGPASDIWASGRGTRIRDALTELHAYALTLDAELRRTQDRLEELGPAGDPSAELSSLRGRQAELTAQLDLLDRTIRALRAATDPAGRYL
jgi:hypothetical protein